MLSHHPQIYRYDLSKYWATHMSYTHIRTRALDKPRMDSPSLLLYTQLCAGAFQTSSEYSRPASKAPHRSPSRLDSHHRRGISDATAGGFRDGRPKAQLKWQQCIAPLVASPQRMRPVTPSTTTNWIPAGARMEGPPRTSSHSPRHIFSLHWRIECFKPAPE